MQAQAEKAAWDYVKKHNIDLVVINPSFVFGPTISKRIDGESSKAMVVCDQHPIKPNASSHRLRLPACP